MPDLAARARTLLDLHAAPDVLVLANVWDVASARVVAATPGVRALATASHSTAATFGYEDGENIPLELHLSMVERIAAAVDLPVTMDFEAGYGDAGETARRAIAAGAVGGNLEDQMRPLDEAVAAVEAVLRPGGTPASASC
jgi:2-methylisocitrate lyase-like PEP mutase family enzyme